MDPTIRESAQARASICRVFGSTYRVMIAWVLGDREMPVSDIAAAVDSSMQNVSQHLRLMKDKGILQSRREGRSIYYRIAENELTRQCPIFQGKPEVQLHFTTQSETDKENDDG